MKPALKVVLAHEWILSASGSDKVAAEIARCFDPVHDEVIVVTAAADPTISAALFPGCEVRTLWTDRLPGVERHWKHYAPALLDTNKSARRSWESTAGDRRTDSNGVLSAGGWTTGTVTGGAAALAGLALPWA